MWMTFWWLVQVFNQHLIDLQNVFDRFKAVNLRLKLPKCHFARREVKYLGHIISNKGIEVDPSKVEAVISYPRPKNVREVRRFLGLAGFYRRHIKDFSKVAHPLNNLLHKDAKFQWTDDCDNAMNTLKKALTDAPVLGYPNYHAPFILTTDASGTALGAILSQVDSSGKEKVIGYHGRSFNDTERGSYSATEKEALAIFDAFKHFKHYIQNVHVTVRTDHQPLKGLFQNSVPAKGRIAKWLVAMGQYDYSIEYVPGPKIGNADSLSRRPYEPVKNNKTLNPEPSPFYDMDETNEAKLDNFPPLSVSTQTHDQSKRIASTQTPKDSNEIDYKNDSDLVSDSQNNEENNDAKQAIIQPKLLEDNIEMLKSIESDQQVFFFNGIPDIEYIQDEYYISGIPAKLYDIQALKDHCPEVYEIVTRSKTRVEIEKQVQHEKDKLTVPTVYESDKNLDKYVHEVGELTLEQLTVSELIKQQNLDPESKSMITYLKTGVANGTKDQQKTTIIQSASYSLFEGLLYHHAYSKDPKDRTNVKLFQIVVPKAFKKAILFDAHDSVLGGHRGISATILKIRENFYWKALETDVASWVKSCPRCNKRGKIHDHKRAPLQPLEPDLPLYHWQIDIAGPLTRSPTGHKYILTCIDIYTKFVEYIPMKDISAVSVSRALFEQIFCRYGTAGLLQSDQGSNFLSAITRSLCHILGVKMRFSSAFHAQSQGAVERTHSVLSDQLAKYINMDGCGEDWINYLAPAAFCHNNTPHATTKIAPNLLVFGRIHRMSSTVSLSETEALPKDLQVQISHLVRRINEYQEEADKNIAISIEKMKREYDKKSEDLQYSVGDLVWLYVPNIPIQITRKLKSPWVGPFRVVEREGTLNYVLRSEITNKKLKFPVHVNRLRRYFISKLRPDEDPDLRQISNKDPDLQITEQDLNDDNFVDSENKSEIKGPEMATSKIQTSDPPDQPLRHEVNQEIKDLDSDNPDDLRVTLRSGVPDSAPKPEQKLQDGAQLRDSAISPQIRTDRDSPIDDLYGASGNDHVETPSVNNDREFKTITHGRTTQDGQTQYGVIYRDQGNQKVPTWINQDELSQTEKEYLESHAVRVLRPRSDPIS